MNKSARIVWSVEMKKAIAECDVHVLRTQRRKPKRFERTVSVEGLSIVVHVVTCEMGA
ncbi:MAG: hypothetical protein PVSMB8_00220 [Vulcanimicrobiaceae bacterium]